MGVRGTDTGIIGWQVLLHVVTEVAVHHPARVDGHGGGGEIRGGGLPHLPVSPSAGAERVIVVGRESCFREAADRGHETFDFTGGDALSFVEEAAGG